MKILVIGSGGREHALAWSFARSPRVSGVYCAPGNAGTEAVATNVDLDTTDHAALIAFARAEGITLTVVGPEAHLSRGIVDDFAAAGLRIFGPSRQAAALEGSKVFMKNLLAKHRIPSAAYAVFQDQAQAVAYLDGGAVSYPVVVKADGLAAGKGVIIAADRGEAVAALELIMGEKAFGEAGSQVVIEEFLTGEEASFIAFTDGKTVLPLPSSQDHKAVFDGDQGPNTGGMGAYSPAPVLTPELERQVMEKIMYPTVAAMAAEGRPYRGMLYAGLMIDRGEAKVLEFNCRFGDPEAQPLLMRLRSDLSEVMDAVIDQRLAEITLDIDPRPTVCVVMAAGGYPGAYASGRDIQGLEAAGELAGVEVFHAGTRREHERIVTAGGRVLGVTALADDLPAAIAQAYRAVGLISWPDCYFRRDIGQKALRPR
ncbi:phosphoribosylamine--glycine ligase [Desulfurivibrio alkaliphilus]|uniref:Phosphoribosylamine--glycine ligase n=1 Tax=Desulfurivibrio alkaliphilus (strain DSM 19089 / UNIQEM U267 / AHT2) TaxID=589865 RepID=D6Z3B7_DESAT|nr:phosphoribosylamine--glycine ligase [Desulfurivibrio alkaliphilus]ADH86042.1 phosphoribosylamine/glycine ligase [Desulfurivibrio alkaliphilus AHT 2]